MSALEPDSDLVKRAIGGDRDAFSTLCERHQPRLWRTVTSVARGADAEDLAQEAVLRAWCAIRTYRGEASFEAWLCRIASNVAHDYHRSAWRRRVIFWQPSATEVCPQDRPDAIYLQRETQRRIRTAVAALPAKQRIPLWLHYFEQFSVAEIARLEHCNESTIRSRMQAGLRRLSLTLDDLIGDAEGEGTEPRVNPKGMET